MKTIGDFLKESRLKHKYSVVVLERETKIKKEYIKAIEAEDWASLPEYPITLGFVKNIAGVLGLSKQQTVAILRRDYPPKKLIINPKPDVSKKFKWSPKLTFIIGIGLVISLILGYLGFQYSRFIQPPVLVVEKPTEGQVITNRMLKVVGKIDMDSSVKVNNQPAFINESGGFETEIEVSKDTKEIVITAESRSGKETMVRRAIKVELDK